MPSSSPHPSRGLSERAIGIGAAAITVLIWTSFILIARASADPSRGGTLSPFDIAFCRIVGAAVILLPWGAWLVRRDRARGIGQASLFGFAPLPLHVTLRVGLFGGFLYAVLAYQGFAFAPAAHASVLMPGSLPLWTTVLALALLGERISAARALALGLIVAGALLVGGASLLRAFDGGQVWKGDALFMLAAFCWSTYSVLARRYRLDAVRATIAVTAFAFAAYVPLYTLALATQLVPGRLLAAPLTEVIFQATYQGWGSVVISGITFTRMIGYFGPVRSTMITALVPGLSALGAVLLLGEPLGWNLLAGLALVTLGILFGVHAGARSALKSKAPHARSTTAGA